MQFFILAVLAALATLTFADEGILFNDCANHEIKQMKVTGCSRSDSICKIHKQTPVVFEADFVANQDTETARLEMFAEISGVTIPVPGLDSNGCNNHNLKCPIKKGEDQVFKYTFNLPSMIPNVKAKVKGQLIGKNGPLACFKVNGQVVEK